MTDRQPTPGVHENYAANLMDEPEICPVCDKQLRPDDWCASDMELGICHADCLKGSPVVDLETGTPIDGEAHTFRYQEETSPAPQSHLMGLVESGQTFANQVRAITHKLHGQAYSSTVSALNQFDADLRRGRAALATEGKLTVADIETLKACDDWKATFEVIAIRRLPSSADSYRAVQQHIDALLERGLLEFGRPNTTYRITAAGRAALATTEGSDNV